MCQPATCPSCHKTTWTGCGQHIDQVKAAIPDNQWCTCTEAATAQKPGIFAGFFGR